MSVPSAQRSRLPSRLRAAGLEPVRHPVCFTGPTGAVPIKSGLCPGCDGLSDVLPRDDPMCFASFPAGAA
jgi:hypothetical protein